MEISLFERIGGKGAVQATVLKLYDKILDDDVLAPFFDDISIDALRNSQAAFVTYAFGGPNHYNGKNLRNVHKKSVEDGLNDTHFDLVATHLRTSMEELNVPTDLIDEAMAIVGSTRDDVLNK